MRSSKTERGGWLPFAVVALVLAAAQLILTDPGRAPSWDEAIFLSQVGPGGPVLPFASVRSRGIVVLVAPFVAAGVPLAAIRVILALGSSVALVAAAAAWRPMVGDRLAAGVAAVLGATWLFLFYGSEVMPNLWVAIALLGACGLLARGLAAQAPRPSWPALAVLAVAAFVRPIDAIVVAVVIAVIAMRRAATLPWVLGVVGAALVGTLPWIVEMSVRFGGPLEAARRALEVGHVGTELDMLQTARMHLAMADGPLLGPDGGPFPVAATLWWLVVLWLAGWYGRRADGVAKVGAQVGFAAGVALLLLYLIAVDGGAPRYLLPAIVLLLMAAAIGASTLERPGQIAVGLAALAWAVVQIGWLGPIHDTAATQRADAQAAGQKVRELAGPGECLIVTTDDYPQLGYASGCRVRWVANGEPIGIIVGDEPTFAVTRGPGSGGDVIVAGYVIADLEPEGVIISD